MKQFTNSSSWIWIILILLLTCFLGARGLNADVIWYDEYYSIGNSGGITGPYNISEVIQALQLESQQHVPGYFVLLSLWAKLLGWHPFVLRILGMFFGMLAIASLYRFGRDFLNPRAALIAPLLLCTSSFFTVQLHEIRMYSMLLMFGIAHVWLYWKINLNKHNSWRLWLSFIISVALILYTHVFSIFLLGALGLTHLILFPKTRKWLQVIIAWGVGGLLFVPWLPNLLSGFRFAESNAMPISRSLSTFDLIYAISKLISNDFPLLIIVIAVLGIYSLLKRPSLILRWLIIFTASIILFFIFFNLILSLITPTRTRYILIAFPFLALLAAYLLSNLRYYLPVTLVFMMIWLISGIQFLDTPAFDVYDGSSKTEKFPPLQDYVFKLQDRVRPQDFLLGMSPTHLVNNIEKLDATISDFYLHQLLGIDGTFAELDRIEYMKGIISKIRNRPYILLTYDPRVYIQEQQDIVQTLENDYQLCDLVLDDPELVAMRYVMKEIDCDYQIKSNLITYSNLAIRLTDAIVDYSPEEDNLRIITGWQIDDDSLLEQYNLSFQVLDANWDKLAQEDRHLYDQIVPWSVFDLPLSDLAKGEYRLILTLYDNNGEKLDAYNSVSGEQSNIITIYTIIVE